MEELKLIKYLDWFNELIDDELIEYFTFQNKHNTCIFYSSLPNTIINDILITIDLLQHKTSSDDTIHNIFVRYQKYKHEEIKDIKQIVIKELLRQRKLYILFAFDYSYCKDDDYEYFIKNIHDSEFAMIIKEIDKTSQDHYVGKKYEVIDYLYISERFEDNKVSHLYICDGIINIPKYGMMNIGLDIYLFDYISTFNKQ